MKNPVAERLRDYPCWAELARLVDEAADEIESLTAERDALTVHNGALRAALNGFINNSTVNDWPDDIWFAAIDAARKA